MITRSLALVLAVGALGAVGCVTGNDAAEDQASVSQNSSHGSNFVCTNNTVDVLCQGKILTSILAPVTVTIKGVGNNVLNGNDLDILSGNLDHVSILDGGILNNDKILDDFKLSALNDIDALNVSHNDINACIFALSVLPICK